MTAKSPDRRKTLVILPDMQKRIMRKATLLPAAALVLLGFAMTWHCVSLIGEARANGVDLPGLRLLLPSVLGFVVAIAGLMFRQALHFSNKLGGPAYRIAKHLREIRQSDGELPGELKLRKGDYLGELRDEVNLFVHWMRTREEPAARPEQVDAELEPESPPVLLQTTEADC